MKNALLSPVAQQAVLSSCSDASDGLETGGVLVGRYVDGVPLVTDACGPPPDSIRRRNNFIRGTIGLDAWLASLWPNAHYLGEWHLHPQGAATASQDDVAAMALIARNPDYHCVNPLLLVVGEHSLSRRRYFRWYVWNVGMKEIYCEVAT